VLGKARHRAESVRLQKRGSAGGLTLGIRFALWDGRREEKIIDFRRTNY
jgi:hypothetical protein